MDLAHLRYFLAVVQQGSMTAAARVLGCSQPTLSAAVQRLEEHFGTTLLLRTPRGVTPTATGLVLQRHARDLFEVLDHAAQEIAGLEGDDVGRFVLGCHDSLGAYFLPGFMPGFLRASPRIDIDLWNGTSAEVWQRVIDRDVHFGLIVNPRPHPDLVLVELFHDAVELFVKDPAPDLEQAHARLKAGPLILAGRVAQSQELLGRLGVDALVPPRILTCGELELVRSLAAEGVGVGILPRRVAAHGMEGRLHRLHPEMPCIPDVICLAWRADLHRTKAATRLKDALVAYGRGLDG